MLLSLIALIVFDEECKLWSSSVRIFLLSSLRYIYISVYSRTMRFSEDGRPSITATRSAFIIFCDPVRKDRDLNTSETELCAVAVLAICRTCIPRQIFQPYKTNIMTPRRKGPFWNATSRTAGQEIIHVLGNPEVHHSCHNIIQTILPCLEPN